tara:strand:- start:410 stop:988 length:579 start_codon:yes stop_codon:yes gene_type:complete
MILNGPNIITVSRIGIIPLIVGMFFLESSTGQWIACGLFALASFTDYIDGYLARAMNQTSSFGTFLDPVADKLLVVCALFMMTGFGQISGSTVIPAILIISRELIVSGLREFLAGLSVKIPVRRLAKWKTMVQMVAISLLIIGDSAHPFIPEVFPLRLIGEIGLYIAAIITLITGYDYLRTSLRYILSSDKA